MSSHSMPMDRTGRAVIQPAVTRVYPSVERAWHGADLTVFVETRWVPDGCAVRIEVLHEGQVLLELDEQPSIDDNRASASWKVELGEDRIGRVLDVHRAAHELTFRAHVDDHAVSGLSSALRVDLTPFVISY